MVSCVSLRLGSCQIVSRSIIFGFFLFFIFLYVFQEQKEGENVHQRSSWSFTHWPQVLLLLLCVCVCVCSLFFCFWSALFSPASVLLAAFVTIELATNLKRKKLNAPRITKHPKRTCLERLMSPLSVQSRNWTYWRFASFFFSNFFVWDRLGIQFSPRCCD